MAASAAPKGSIYHFFPGGKLELATVALKEAEQGEGQWFRGIFQQGESIAQKVELLFTSAANLQLRELKAGEPLRRIDEGELAESDRALIARSVLLAYQYGSGAPYELAVEATRFPEEKVLEAVADRTQLTTVVTEAGEMLTQASFMVKNNDKQFQKFTLPKGASFWSAYVNGQPSKAEADGDALLVPLPRQANRDQAFAVEIVYAQKVESLKSLSPRSIALAAPKNPGGNSPNGNAWGQTSWSDGR